MAIATIKQLKSAKGGSREAIAKYLRQVGGYYAQEGAGFSMPPAEWLGGKTVIDLGLNDPDHDADADLVSLLGGFAPGTKEEIALVQNAGKAGRTWGHDFTLSAGKEYSLAFAAASPELRQAMTDVFNHARDKALGYVTENANTRAGHGGTEKVSVGEGGLIVRSVQHIDSREGEPHWHCHNVIVNMAKDDQGKFRALEAESLYHAKGVAQEVFGRELAQGFQRLGFGIVRERVLDRDGRDTGQIRDQIAGIDRATVNQFSTRSRQIAKAQEVDPAKTKAQAWADTRKGKEKTAEEVITDAQAAFADLQNAGKIDWKDAGDLRGRPGLELPCQSHKEILEQLHATESAWTRQDYIAKMLKETPLDKALTTAQIVDDLDRRVASGEIKSFGNDKGQRWFCSTAQYGMEQKIVQTVAEKDPDNQWQGLTHQQINDGIAAQEAEMSLAAGKPVRLSEEQRKGVAHAAGPGDVSCVIGRAGTGKTATAGAYVKALQGAGYDVIGTSTSQVATDNLGKEAKIPAFNLDKFLHRLDRGDIPLTRKSVVLMDEAGMVSAQAFRRVQEHVEKAGGKLIAVGDDKQLQAVGAGSPFRALVERFGAASLVDIRRQRGQEENELARAFYDDAKTGADLLEEMRQIGSLRVEKNQIKALADDFLKDPAPAREKLIIVHTHGDSAAVSQRIRAGLKDRGELSKGETVNVPGPKGMGEKPLEVCVGERLRFTKNGGRKGPDVFNGEIGTVESMERGDKGLTLRVRLESQNPDRDGKQVKIRTWEYNRLDHGYARTAHSAQGLGVSNVYWLARASGNVDRNAGLVAMTRTKQAFKAYVSPGEAEKLGKHLDEWGKKETAQEIEQRLAQSARDIGPTIKDQKKNFWAWRQANNQATTDATAKTVKADVAWESKGLPALIKTLDDGANRIENSDQFTKYKAAQRLVAQDEARKTREAKERAMGRPSMLDDLNQQRRKVGWWNKKERAQIDLAIQNTLEAEAKRDRRVASAHAHLNENRQEHQRQEAEIQRARAWREALKQNTQNARQSAKTRWLNEKDADGNWANYKDGAEGYDLDKRQARGALEKPADIARRRFQNAERRRQGLPVGIDASRDRSRAYQQMLTNERAAQLKTQQENAEQRQRSRQRGPSLSM